MSKRGAEHQGGQDRYGGSVPDEMSDKPVMATAAQLAKRKIAQAKGTRRPRSESPATNTGSIYDQASQSGFLNNMNQNNSFSPAPNFAFTNGTTQSFGSGGGSFTFGNGTQHSTPNTNSFTFGGTPSFQFGGQPSQPNGGFSFGNGDTTKAVNPFEQKTSFGGNEANTPNSFGNANSNGTFGQKPAETSAFPGFGQGAQKTAESTPAFGSTQKTAETSTFPGFGQAQNGQKSSTPTFTGFGSTQNGQKNADTPTFLGFGSTQKTADTPTFGSTQNGQKPETTATASDGWSSFLNKPAEKPTTNGFTPSASIFSQTNGASQNGVFAGFGDTQKTPNFKFTAQPEDNDASMMSPENTPQKNGTKDMEAAQLTGKGPSLFDRISKSPPKAAAAPVNLFASSSTAASAQSAPIAATPAAKTSMEKTKPEHFAGIRELNEALLHHLKTQDLNKDWSSIFQYYQHEISQVQSDANAKSASGLGNSILGKPSQSLFSTSTPAEPSYPALPESSSATSKLFQAALDRPNQPNAAASLFAKPAETSKPAESQSSLFAAKPDAPAVESQSSSLFGAKPGASLFSSNTPAPSASLFGAKPSSGSLFAAKPNEAPASSLFSPDTSTPLFKPSSTPSLFKPSDGTKSNTDAPSLFKAAGFTPTVAPASGSFLSSFGQQAAQNAEKEKKRRRDEDFDSDEENEADWEKRDAEEQAAKRAKIEEAANQTGFIFKPTTGASASIFKPTTTEASTSVFKPTTTEAPTSIFKPTTTEASTSVFKPTTEASTKSASTEASTSIFKPATNEPTQEDHTWKQGTPIKFGGAVATPSKGLFGSTPGGLFNASSTPVQKPAFSFGQPSTPAPAAPAAADDADEDAAPPEPQLDDMAVLLPSEKDESDVLYYVEKSKSRKLEAKPTEGGGEKLTWIDKGNGPIWILKNKSTGKTRVLQKIKDSGRAAMNFGLLPGDTLYKHEGMGGRCVMATFVDHISDKAAKKPSSWAVIVGQVEDAKNFARILKEQQKA